MRGRPGRPTTKRRPRLGSMLSTRGRRFGALGAVILVLAAIVLIATRPAPAAITAIPERITVPGGPGVAGPVVLDATLYLPARTPAPAVIVAHGFGGSKDSVAGQAEDLARSGLVALAYSARGFGDSTGQIGLDSLDYEVPDARALVDWLGRRPEVIKDGPDDPRVGVTGGSYGGALALMLAGTDHRVDAVVAAITWNDLARSLFPDSVAPEQLPPTPAAVGWGGDGVFKRNWAAALIASVTTGAALAGTTPGASTGSPATTSPATTSPAAVPPDAVPPGGAGSVGCGRLMPDICAAYADVAQTGRLTPAMAALLARSSPAAVVGHITAPTLLVQGEQDTLFGLDQADANAAAIAANGTPVAVSWYNGGHDGGAPDPATQARMTDWLVHYLTGRGTVPQRSFDYALAGGLTDTGQPRTRILRAPGYPGLPGAAATPRTAVPLSGPAQVVVNPPGGSPAAITSLPGLGALASAVAGAARIPGQTAVFTSAPLPSPTVITGTAALSVQVQRLPSTAGSAADGGGVIYASLWKVSASGTSTLASGSVAPLRFTDLPAGGTATLRVDLSPVAFQVEAGSRIQVALATTNDAYFGPTAPAAYRISLTGTGDLTVPEVAGVQVSGSDVPLAALVGAAALAALLVLALLLGGRVRRRRADFRPDLQDVPLTVDGLAKTYAGGVAAVRAAAFTLRRGQILGLLGENGAGKTTTLRMVMGLILPTDGEIRLFGHRIRPGAEVLSRVGSLLEGPGFLPHLSGRANIDLYWRATGRPRADAHTDLVLEIAGLGAAIDRRVKTYSQGMRQRLAIAQAMLGLPDLLILDEPTNGLDPPQIHAMREVLRRYAATGRTVLLSSHLLSEVEQTCSHVVVMHRGRTVAAGAVPDMVAASGEMTFQVDDVATACRVLETLPGVTGVAGVIGEEGTVRANVGGAGAASAVRDLVGAGVAVSSASPRRRLEDVFLDLIDDSPKEQR